MSNDVRMHDQFSHHHHLRAALILRVARRASAAARSIGSPSLPLPPLLSQLRFIAFFAVLASACIGTAEAPPIGAWASATSSGTAFVVLLEPGVCLGCSQMPRELEKLKQCADGAVNYVWRRPPTEHEERQALPLRLGIHHVLETPFPASAPTGPTYLLYSRAELVGVSLSHQPQAADSLVARALTLEGSKCSD